LFANTDDTSFSFMATGIFFYKCAMLDGSTVCSCCTIGDNSTTSSSSNYNNICLFFLRHLLATRLLEDATSLEPMDIEIKDDGTTYGFIVVAIFIPSLARVMVSSLATSNFTYMAPR
jgi:hypothetical protein